MGAFLHCQMSETGTGSSSPASDPLQPPWTLWVFDADSEKKGKSSLDSYNTALKKIYTFTTIQKFWTCFDNLPKSSNLPYNSCYHIMRDDIEPKWEYKDNAGGGIFCVRVPKAKTEKVWTDLVLSAIGEQFAAFLDKGDQINGITLSAKHKDNVIQIWNMKSDANLEDIKTRIKDLTGVDDSAIFYKLCTKS